MSRWTSNATWQEPGTWFSGRKGAKSARSVALVGSEVVLGVQRDVAGTASLDFVQKRVQKWEPHVALAVSEVVLGVQRDVAAAGSLCFEQKRGQKW